MIMNNTDLQVRYHKETEQQVLQTGKQMNLYYTNEYVRWLEAKVLQQVSGVNSENEKALPINGVSNRAEVISDIVKSLKSDEPNYVFKDCPICKGKGYTHGYGTHSIEPDWCDECGGPGEVVDEDATHLVKLQIVSKVLKEYGY